MIRMIKSVVLSTVASLRRLYLRAANVLQDPFAQQVGVALASFREIDDFVGDGVLDEIVGVAVERASCLAEYRLAAMVVPSYSTVRMTGCPEAFERRRGTVL
jgi:hypothetical protein